MATEATVKLTYFKAWGKYYTEGEFQVDPTTPWLDVIENVRNRIHIGDLPGLGGRWLAGPILLSSDQHPGAFPLLFMSHCKTALKAWMQGSEA